MAHIFSVRNISRFPFIRGFTQLEILVIIFIIGIMAAIAAPSFGGMLEAAKMKQTTVELRSAFQETQRHSIRNNQSCEARVLIPSETKQGSVVQSNCLSSGDRSLPQGIGLATNVLPSSDPITDGFNRSPKLFPDSITVHRASFEDVICLLLGGCNAQRDTHQNNDDDNRSSNINEHDANEQSNGNASNSSESPDESPSSRKKVEVGVGFGPLGGATFEIATQAGSPSRNGRSAKFVAFRPNKQEASKTCLAISGSLGLTRIGTYQGPLSPLSITTEGTCQVGNWTEQ